MNAEEFEKVVLEHEDKLDDPARAVPEHEGWTFGERAVVVEDDDENGLCAGDEGIVIIEELGAAEYNSQRIATLIVVDGMGDPVEVNPYNIDPVS